MPIISTDSTTGAKFDGTPQTIVVKSGVLVYSYSNSGPSATILDDGFSGATLINYGHVVGDGVNIGAWFKDDARSCTVVNAAGADIVGGGVVFDGFYGRLSNAGVISSDNEAVAFGDGGFLDNSGTIDGQLYVTVKTIGFTLHNTGTIDLGGSYAIINFNDVVSTRSSFHIVNSATINGGFYFNPATSAGNNFVTNSGLIAGDITSFNLVDTINNRGGHITGDVSLGDGADTVDNRGGHIDGIVRGGAGDDTYIVDATALSIVEVENEGSDTVVASTISLSLANYTNIENLKLLGGLSLNLTGDDGANVLTGNVGRNILTGGLGGDTYYVQNATDKVVEASGGGYDTVHSTVSYTLGANIERLILDSGAVSGTGNNSANTLTGNELANVFTGAGGADTLDGAGGSDTASYATAASAVTANLATGGTLGDAAGDKYVSIENLTGSKFADALTGDAGANVIDGGAGADTMAGGAGADVYYVDNAGDTIAEAKGAGEVDSVHATVSFSLAGQHLEALYLDGAAAINGTGNSLNNYVQGNGAANVIEGGSGDDDLVGGGGADTFVFHAGFGSDFVSDFGAGSAAGHDVIRIDKAVFANFTTLMSHAVETNDDGHYFTTITFDAKNLILLDNVHKADLVSADVVFV